MSGPEWGYLSLGKGTEIKGALPEILWSPDSKFLAFVQWHIQDVPNRKGAEGYSFRVAILRIVDRRLRYVLGNMKLASVKLRGLTAEELLLSINDQPKAISLAKVNWEPLRAEP
jgi:hypothetical protein